MKKSCRILLSALVLLGCVMVQGSLAEEQEVALKEVPKVVKKAARKAVPGIKFTEAEKETTEEGVTVYELEGIADGKEYELKISADGKVLEKETEGLGADHEGEGEGDADHDADDDSHDDEDDARHHEDDDDD